MKRNSIYKSLVVSVALSAFLTGCGSSSSSDPKVSSYINGKAIDGYLQYSTVCLDLNNDGYCQDSEPHTQTKDNGSFTLEIAPDVKDESSYDKAMLLVYGGKDIDTGVAFHGNLLAPKSSDVVNITPLTTVVAKAVQQQINGKNVTEDEIEKAVSKYKQKVADIYGLNVEDLDKDIVSLDDKRSIKAALKLQKSIELVANGDDKMIEKYYDSFAKNLDNSVDGDELFEKSISKSDIKNAKALQKNIEKSFEKGLDLPKIATIIKRDLSKARKDKAIDEIKDSDDRFHSSFDWDSEFIKADLNFDNISDDDIEKFKTKFEGDIKPGFIFDKKDELKDDDDSFFKDIFKKIEKEEIKEKAKRDIFKDRHSGKKAPFKQGDIFYALDDELTYSKIVLDNDSIIVEDYRFDGDKFIKESTNSDEIEYILKDGSWEKDDKSVVKYKLKDGQITLEDGYIVEITSQIDISGKEFYVQELDKVVHMPKGAKVSYIQVKSPKHTKVDYILYKEVRTSEDVTTLDDLIAKKGLTKKEIDGMEIAVDKNDIIYSYVDGKLYEGFIDNPNEGDNDEDIDVNFNEIAMSAIKPYLKYDANTVPYTNTIEIVQNKKDATQIVHVKKREDRHENDISVKIKPL